MADSRGRIGADKPVRVEDVAREAGVSPITVSRTLSSPDLVRPETRAKVAAAVEKTGYVINSLASSLRSGRSNIIAVFAASLQNPHFADVIQGIFDVFEGSGFHLLFSQMGYSEEVAVKTIEAILPFRPAGLMFTGIVREAETRQALQRVGSPVVEMWGDSDAPIDMLVRSSAFEGGRLMGEHFARQGFRRVVYCGHTQSRGAERVAGFTQGLALAGVRPALIVPMEGTRLSNDGVAAIDQIRRDLPDCEAVFFGTDVLAAGAYLRMRQLGLDIPHDMAIAGYGDLDFAEQLDPRLTTIHVAGYEIGQNAGRLLLSRLTGGNRDPQVISVPALLVARESTSAPV